MSRIMKDPRDLRLIGIGFLLGMVVCYFLMMEEPTPPVFLATNQLQIAQVTTPPALIRLVSTNQVQAARGVDGPQAGQIKQINLQWNKWTEEWVPKAGRSLQIFPAEKMDDRIYWIPDRSHLPGMPAQPRLPQYDLIDWNYKPDFKLPD